MTLRTARAAALLATVAILACGPAAGGMEPIGESDRQKGTRAAHSTVASDRDLMLLADAFAAADRNDWAAARGLAARTDSPVGRSLIEWRYVASHDSGARFDEIDGFIRAHADWPRIDGLRALAEQAMPDAMAPQQVIAWFAGREPQSGEGLIKLGAALAATGDARGAAMVRRGWIEGDFKPEREYALNRAFGRWIDAEAHRTRLSRLLFDRDRAGAARALQLVDGRTRRIAEARLALQLNARGAQQTWAQLPGDLRDDPGLLFDKARWLRRFSDERAAVPLLRRAPADPDALVKPDAWWSERHIQARTAIGERDHARAYALVTGHGMTRGGGFADAEFLAGWLALRHLNRPADALEHFRRLRSGVGFPISVARAHYWAGRAAEALGRAEEARREYQLAAENTDTFYGQLAAVALTARAPLRLPGDPPLDTAARTAFAAKPVVRAVRLLYDLGEPGIGATFINDMARTAPDAATLRALSELALQHDGRRMQIRVAKTASQRNMPIMSAAFPILPLPAHRGPAAAPEKALVLALSRQESEFDTNAVSHAGARGLMQLMPATARTVSGWIGESYAQSRLTSDPTYNMQLGMAYLGRRIADYGGSYILATASYNAGTGNVDEWLSRFGDPRSPSIDPIDWIETIPFGETRNYVQRVLENTQIYRARLQDGAPIEIAADLMRGRWGGGTALPSRADAPVQPAAAPAAPAPAAPAVSVPQPKPEGRHGASPGVRMMDPIPDGSTDAAPDGAMVPKPNPKRAGRTASR